MFETGRSQSTARRRLRAGAAQKVNLLACENKIAGGALHKSVARHKSSCGFPGPNAIPAFELALPRPAFDFQRGVS
jgi:hypothetical protein